MKPIEYSSQEQKAIDAADRVVLRTLHQGKWNEVTSFPQVGETLMECIERYHALILNTPEYSRVVMYIGTEDSLACIPRGYIPEQIKEKFKGKDEDKRQDKNENSV